MDTRIIPQHIVIIMGGNGYWVKKRGLSRTAEHKQGAEDIGEIAVACNVMGVKALAYYASSAENWERPQDETDYPYKLPELLFGRYLVELKKNNIKVTFLEEVERFPDETRRVITTVVGQTQENTGLIPCLAVSYDPRREITLAAQRYAQDVQQEEASPEIDENAFGSYIVIADMSEPDLMIRANGELCINNSLLWQLAYAELIFTPVAWPGFSQEELNRAIDEFNHRDHRLGGL